MNRRRTIQPFAIFLGLTGALGEVAVTSAQISDASAVTAHIRPLQDTVPAGQPVWVDFMLHNPTEEVAVLGSGPPLETTETVMGLPLSHVMGSSGDGHVHITLDDGTPAGCGRGLAGSSPQTAIRLAPGASVGLRVDLAEVCSALVRGGRYRVAWNPYGGDIRSEAQDISVLALRQARIRTDHGDMVMRLLYEDAPRHVENFLELAEQDFYNGLTFHRIVPDFLIQGGAPGQNPAAIRDDGKRLDPEFNDRPFVRGTVAMARWPGDPGSASCQFFIAHTRIPDLDGNYTAFGELVGEESFETLQKLMERPVDSNDMPLNKVYIRSVRIEKVIPAYDGGSSAPR